jgi:anti-sigma regulatory factor (Ser/Thr protein kinase)
MRPPEGFRDDVALVAIRVPGHEPDRFVDVFPAEEASIPAARARLRAWLAQHELDADECNDVLLAVGEATANAVEHGSSRDGSDVVGVEVVVHDGELVAAVVDSGTWDGNAQPRKRDEGGRGYPIMRAVMDVVDLHRSRLGTTVVLRRTLGAHRLTHIA